MKYNKFETRESDLHKGRYGCYNLHMDCFHFVYEWHGATHTDFGVAMLMTKELNNKYHSLLNKAHNEK